jgi:Concanavalin A-like lectin/glucanases superfamily/FecR protein
MIDHRNEHLEFEGLLARLTESGLDPSELQRLGTFIELDQSLRRRYLEYCQMHALLRSEHGLLAAWSPTASHPYDAHAGRLHRWWQTQRQVFYLAAAAALLVVAAGIGLVDFHLQLPPFRGEETAVLSKGVGARFAYGVKGETKPSDGVHLRQGVYELRDGMVEIEYASGAVLVARAPATFNLVDKSCVRLEDGQLAAHVPKAAVGFRVEAPGATVIDLGTDFAVQAARQKDSEVHVFKGEVLVDLRGEKGQSADLLRLVTGEATRVDCLTGMPSGIDLGQQQFLRSLRDETSAYARTVLAMTPAVYYRMEPTGDGTQLVDSSASGANATIRVGRATSPVWTTGKVGAALQLGGPSQQSFAAAAHYPQADGDAISVAAWIYARSRPRWASIAKNWAGGDARGQFHFGLYEDGGELEAHIVDNSGKEIVVRDRVPLPLNSWHHVAFVADGENLKLYRNGVEIVSMPYQELHRDPRIKALAIGTKLNLVGNAPEERDFNMWDGCLDELAIFNHALTSDQIVELYRSADAAD